MARAASSGGDRLTVEQYQALPGDERHRDELVRGRVVREPRPGAQHARLQVRLGRFLDEFVERESLGWVLGDVGYVLANDPPTVLGPDLSFVATGRLPGNPTSELPRLAPYLAVEIISPSNRYMAMQAKVLAYLGAGVRMVWVIDPRSRTVTEHRSGLEARLLGEADELDGADVLPAFRLPLRRLFAR
jgi:Uma2 family endonuclease